MPYLSRLIMELNLIYTVFRLNKSTCESWVAMGKSFGSTELEAIEDELEMIFSWQKEKKSMIT